MAMVVHITTGSGKLKDIRSINTSTLGNEYCSKMRQTDSVCKKCYAARYEKLRPNITTAFERNNFMSKRLLTEQEVPRTNDNIFRFHSYGELINSTHFRNYLTIARENPWTTFALWTKRDNIVNKVLKDEEKPSNLILVYSSTLLDNTAPLPKWFDKVFSVFTKTSTGINCHGACNTCRLCYTHNDVVFINEVAK